MIVKMSKIEIIGLRQFLTDVLELLWQEGLLHIDPATVGFIEESYKRDIRSILPDEKTLYEKIYLDGLKEKITTLISYLPNNSVRVSSLTTQPIVDTISSNLDKHLTTCGDLFHKKETLLADRKELDRYRSILKKLEGIMEELPGTTDIDYIGTNM